MSSTPVLNDEIATRYDTLAESTCCLSCGGAVELATPQPGEVCVDLGSGRGHDVLRLAETVGPTGRAIGIDTADRMLARAGREALKLGVANAEFHKGTLEATGLPERTADLVISNCAINHAADKDAVWREVYRVLKPGGRFVVSDIYSLAPVPAQYRDDAGAVAECWAGAVPRAEYLETLARTGFADVQIREESAPYKKGAIEVASWTLTGRRPSKQCACSA